MPLIAMNTWFINQLVGANMQLSFGQSARFSDTDLMQEGANLYTLDILDQNIVLFHCIN